MLLEIKDLEVFFKSSQGIVKAVNKVNINTRDGKTTAIVGESGSGKSVTTLAIMGLLDKSSLEKISGEINFEGKNLLKATPEELRRIRGNEISMIFQEPMTSLNPALKVGYQMSEVFRTHFDMDKKTAKEMSIEMIKKVEISRAEDVYNSYPHELSGGMRQRIMIAMALSSSPKLLIADEPTTALDVTIQAQILKLMNELKEKQNTSILFITHDLGVINQMADEVAVMYCGQIVEQSPVDYIFKHDITKYNHPYTVALLNSIPAITSDRNERLDIIPGSVPHPLNLPDGCKFADRCKYATEKCRKEMPELVSVNENQKIRCHYPNREERENGEQ